MTPAYYEASKLGNLAGKNFQEIDSEIDSQFIGLIFFLQNCVFFFFNLFNSGFTPTKLRTL